MIITALTAAFTLAGLWIGGRKRIGMICREIPAIAEIGVLGAESSRENGE
jgi:hypothetical protein